MKSTCSEGSRLVRVDGYDPGPTGQVHVHVQSGVTCRGRNFLSVSCVAAIASGSGQRKEVFSVLHPRTLKGDHRTKGFPLSPSLNHLYGLDQVQ